MVNPLTRLLSTSLGIDVDGMREQAVDLARAYPPELLVRALGALLVRETLHTAIRAGTPESLATELGISPEHADDVYRTVLRLAIAQQEPT